MIALGINSYHADSAAAIVVDGEVIAAAEEERFLRVKHWAGFPAEAIRYCLREAGVGLAELTHVGVNTDPRASRWRRIGYALTHWPSPALVLEKLRARGARLSVRDSLAAVFPGQTLRAEVVPVEHHLAHLASAYFASPFDEAVAVSVDGFGDFSSAAWGIGRGATLTVDGRVGFPSSLGVFYQALTQYLGFPHYGDEYKVMGLAPYGEPTHAEAIRRLVRTHGDGTFELRTRYFRHHRERIAFSWSDGVPVFAPLFSRELERLLGPARGVDEPIEQRHKDIARSVQVVFEEAYFGLLRHLAARHATRNVVLAGGCAQNSVANGKITRETSFERVYVAAAGYDAGGALGAALWLANRGGRRCGTLDHASLGPRFDSDEIAALLEAQSGVLRDAQCAVERIDEEQALFERVIDSIEAGGVVGWFHERMEWGPRALGNRSILADPRRADMKDILNHKIKRRESFRPFAPSVLREHVADWFELDADVPFMGQVFPIRAERRAAIPAVTHVDGTGRLQTVARATQPRYHGLISRFHARTGVPMLLNTSFNENEPIVCRPDQALECFLRTRMDLLVLEDYVISRFDTTR